MIFLFFPLLFPSTAVISHELCGVGTSHSHDKGTTFSQYLMRVPSLPFWLIASLSYFVLLHKLKVFTLSLGSGTEGADDLCFHICRNFSSSSFSSFFFSSVRPPPSKRRASKLKSQPWGSNPSLEAQIPASKLKSQPQSSNLSLEAAIPASKLKSQPSGPNSIPRP